MLFLMAQRWQAGHLYEANSAWHVRYITDYISLPASKKTKIAAKCAAKGAPIPSRVQESKRLCDGDIPSKMVKQLFTEFMEKINNQNFDQPSSSDTTVVDFWDNNYLPFIESNNNLKPSTVHGYKQVWNQHLKTHFGTTLLNNYRTSLMTNFLTQLSKKYRPRTLNHIKWLASGVFDHAVATGKCETNPIKDAKVLGKMLPNGVTESYTLEEIENIIGALVEHVAAQLVMALSFFAGLRKGEIQGLQWNDIDQNYIHVRRAVTRRIVGTPKTAKSVRSIPIIEPVRLFLGLWRKRCRGDGWVFPNERGNPVELKDMACRVIRPALERAGLTWKGYHSGRRGLGTTLRELTGNSNAGRDMLGHSNAQVTEQHYEAAMPEEVLKGMRLLEAKSTKK
jgi:integrase